ncbi:calcyphosin-like protein isoform X1 [Hydra vulgaris]|uniref:calcyphosin-like protein isoform X1 n=1 Tax=Hydra vulgaris TaxID=6087 RepID=UPI0001923AB2|nr:calcyphosin-like protein [Hydra vulgaris]
MEEFRAKLVARGASSIKGIGRAFRIYDDDGNKMLSLEEFCKGVKDFGLDFSHEKCISLFKEFDKDGSGYISFDEFLLGLRGNLVNNRLKVVQEAFKKADVTGDGILDAKDLKRVYKVTEHPKYKNGQWDENRVFQEFLNSFEPDEKLRDGKVTEEEFINYYAGVSANIDSDGYFTLMIRNAWKI